MVTKTLLNSREEWLEERNKTIGGSDAAAVIGMNPWLSNVALYDMKKNGKYVDLAANANVLYGQLAEEPLRRLFELDYPGLDVFYEENNLFRNSDYPWAHASLDGWLQDKDGRRGVLEIKTSEILSSAQSQKLIDKIPDHYYAQVLHEMAVYEADFAVIKAQLKYKRQDVSYTRTNHYFIERSDVQEEIEYLMDAERTFYKHLQDNEPVARILPEI